MKKKYLMLLLSIFISLLILTTNAQVTKEKLKAKKVVKNADIIRMTKADFDPEIIVSFVSTNQTNFNLSLDALIQLKNAGVNQKVIVAMQRKQNGTSTSSKTASGKETSSTSANTGQTSVSEVYLFEDSKVKQMKKAIPNTGSGMSAKSIIPIAGMFLGKAKTYVIFPSTRASLRLGNRKPKFQITLPTEINPSYVAMVLRLQMRIKKGNRRIRTGKAQGLSSAVGFRKDSIVPIEIKVEKTTVILGKKYTTYTVEMIEALKTGEYVLKVGDSFYDFGVDS